MNNENLKPALENTEPAAQSSAVQHEDVALKTAFRYFADELLPYFGIQKKAVRVAPTELVHLEVKTFHEDFNLVMEDGSWAHFEFQSENEGREGLKRFRAYEAVASYQYKVPVTTYVLFSGKIQRPMTEFTEGINTFQIVPVIMRGHNADQLIQKLQEKQKSEEITKDDLVQLSLCLLMNGEMSLKDRAMKAYQITETAASVDRMERNKIETVLYVMADKFLKAAEKIEFKEAIRMTELGQMLVNEGIEQGIQQGIQRGIEQEKLKIAKKLIGILDEETIAEQTELPLKTVQQLKENQVSVPAL